MPRQMFGKARFAFNGTSIVTMMTTTTTTMTTTTTTKTTTTMTTTTLTMMMMMIAMILSRMATLSLAVMDKGVAVAGSHGLGSSKAW